MSRPPSPSPSPMLPPTDQHVARLTLPFPLPAVLLCPVEGCVTRYANTDTSTMRHSLQRHIRRCHSEHANAKWYCRHCGVEVSYHLTNHRCRAPGQNAAPEGPVIMPFGCQCGRSFPTKRGLINHHRACLQHRANPPYVPAPAPRPPAGDLRVPPAYPAPLPSPHHRSPRECQEAASPRTVRRKVMKCSKETTNTIR